MIGKEYSQRQLRHGVEIFKKPSIILGQKSCLMEHRKSWMDINKVEFEEAILRVLRWQIHALLTEWVRREPKSGRRPDPSHRQTPRNVRRGVVLKVLILPYSTFITVISPLMTEKVQSTSISVKSDLLTARLIPSRTRQKKKANLLILI